MRNEELLLSNYPFILELMNAGHTIKQITEDVNKYLDANTTYRQLLYLINRVRDNTIHKEYDNIVIIDNMKDAWDKNLGNYCVDFHGLLITYKSAAHLTNPEYIITPENITTLYGEESLIYAKRIIKQYHIPDVELLRQHKIVYPKGFVINLAQHVNNINNNLNAEFAAILTDLRHLYIKFLTNKGDSNA